MQINIGGRGCALLVITRLSEVAREIAPSCNLERIGTEAHSTLVALCTNTVPGNAQVIVACYANTTR